MRRGIIIIFLVTTFGVSFCGGSQTRRTEGPVGEEPNAEFRTLRDAHIERWSPLEAQYNLAEWEAYLSGREEDSDRCDELEMDLRNLHSDRETFETLRSLRQSQQITDPMLARQLEVLYRAFEENQTESALAERIVAAQSDLRQRLNNYRATIGEEEFSSNEVYEVLADSDDSARRQAVWEASKGVGEQIAPRLIELVNLRNQAATALGYQNYYVMMLNIREQDPEEIQQVFDELATVTDEPFRAVKAQLDASLAERFGVAVDDLRPWHYADPFFQSTPGAGIDLDPLFANDDRNHVVSIATNFYEGIGLPVVNDILERSDLFERDGKSEHAFCWDIDRSGDIRILTNLQNDERWMGTLLHELGHGVYDAYIDMSLPFELRGPAHIFTTEGVAELFGMLTHDPVWLQRNGNVPDDATANFSELVLAEHRLDLLIFARWTLVMLNFERELYTNPNRDMNGLWWDLVERYQYLRRPDTAEGGFHWASKGHLVFAAVYYHNYMLGRMFASQLRHRLSEEVPETMASGSFDMQGQPAVGRYLIEHVFRPGRLYPWSEFVRRSTGEELTARYFAEEIQPPPSATPVTPAEPTEGDEPAESSEPAEGSN